jgi:RNA polymerase sigma-70 factor, ECF subfamily
MEAFAAIFHAHKRRIYSLCCRMVKNSTEAEDLTQDTFLQAFRKLSTFRGDSAFSTWLYRIGVNTVLMHFRQKSPTRVSLDEPYGNNEDARPARREYGAEDGHLSGCIDRIALTRAISELPEGYRTVFLLHEVEGYEHREIAEFLGCSTGNCKSQLHKARLRIRELLNQSLTGARSTARSPERKSIQIKSAPIKAATRVKEWELSPTVSRAHEPAQLVAMAAETTG